MESEYINRTNHIKEYIKIHIISLEQDLEQISSEMEALDPASKDFADLDFEYNFINGQVAAFNYVLTKIGLQC